MRKFLIAAALAALPLPAAAGPYIGAELNYAALADRPAQPQHIGDGLSAHVGWQFNDHLGLEAGYVAFSGGGLGIKGPTVDGFAYLPVHGSIKLFATAGVSYLHAEFKPAPTAGVTPWRESEAGWRTGAGVEWRIVRVTARWQSMDFSGHEGGALVIGAGLNFKL